MPKKNSRYPYRQLLIKEITKTSKAIQEYDKGLPEFDPFCREETYESWSLEDLEKGIKDDIKMLKDFEISWTLPEVLSHLNPDETGN